MGQFDPRKLVGAVALAVGVALVSGFVAKTVVMPKMPAKNAYVVAVAAPAAAPAQAASAMPETAVKTAAAEASTPAAVTAPDAAAGQKVARVCAACHSFEKGGANKIGPALYGIVGHKHAAQSGFKYSDAMQKTADKVWDEAALDAFLTSPKAYIPGTKMAFAGVKNPTDRANLIAWLKTLSSP